MSSWHNRLGDGAERLTILSVLPRVELSDAELRAADELSLRQAIDELYRIAGDDGEAQVLMLRASGDGTGPDEATVERMSLKDLADRLYGSFGQDGEARSTLRVLGPHDDPLSGLTEDAAAAEGSDTGLLAALRRFRESVHRLFGGSAEQGAPPTVLSLLVDQRATQDDPAPKP